MAQSNWHIPVKHPICFTDFMDEGIAYPHPTATRAEVDEWIREHADLLTRIRKAILDESIPHISDRGDAI